FLVQHHTGFSDYFAGFLVHYVTDQYPTQYTLTQCSDDVATLDDRTHYQAFLGTAVFFGNYQVLGNIYQTTGQVTGVRCFQSGIRQTFTRTVSRGEVLHNAQTFAEVRGDWRFDNGAVRTRHQTTHTSQLTDLCGRTPRTGVRVNVYGVERLLTLFLTFAVDNRLCRQAFHHRFGNQIVCT